MFICVFRWILQLNFHLRFCLTLSRALFYSTPNRKTSVSLLISRINFKYSLPSIDFTLPLDIVSRLFYNWLSGASGTFCWAFWDIFSAWAKFVKCWDKSCALLYANYAIISGALSLWTCRYLYAFCIWNASSNSWLMFTYVNYYLYHVPVVAISSWVS